MTETLKKDTGWCLNLEIEPETWNTVSLRDPENYTVFKKMINTPSASRIEYVNPDYAQSYLYNISGNGRFLKKQFKCNAKHYVNVFSFILTLLKKLLYLINSKSI